MELTSSNVSMLLEMEECDSLGTQSLKPHIENFLEGIRFWTWFELLEALKQFQESLSSKGYLEILDRIIDQLIERLASPCTISSPYACSSNTSSFRFSCDTSSLNSLRNNFSEVTWWFEHLLFLKIDLLDKIIRKMISYDFDHSVVSKFLFYYYHKLSYVSAAQDVKIETIKVVITLLSLLDIGSISCKGLFNLNRIAISLKISKFCRNTIESLIGPILDQVTIDYLLLPSPHDRDHAYDVDFVLRVMKNFLLGGNFELNSNRVKKVTKMIDLFLVEVSPDPHLQPCEFEALITVIPDTMRESHDQLYLAMDMYLKVHAGISEEEKMNICCKLNHEKLSPDILRHLTRSLIFPSETKPRSDVTRHSRMKTLLQENDHLKNFFSKPFKNISVKEDAEKIIYDDDDDDDQELKRCGDLEEMESVTHLARVKKSAVHTMGNTKYLPKFFCS